MKSRTSPQVSLLSQTALVLHEYSNKETDNVQHCFRADKYFSLRDLPDEITANIVNQSMRERLEKAQIISAINAQNRKIYGTLGGGGDEFKRFDWLPDAFGAGKAIISRKLL